MTIPSVVSAHQSVADFSIRRSGSSFRRYDISIRRFDLLLSLCSRYVLPKSHTLFNMTP
ncbi:hypothetical protein ACQKNC_17760 [Lysinibacillus sp. NPDC094177]|uniref:hypothetical protein n=1 Tax=Lysinibacillus sp. NPDC094177 TaxID=3390580 RepID=UPI003D045D3F